MVAQSVSSKTTVNQTPTPKTRGLKLATPWSSVVSSPDSLDGKGNPRLISPLDSSSYHSPKAPKTSVGVFWDVENCALSSSSDKDATLEALLECVAKLGDVKQKKVFCDLKHVAKQVQTMLKKHHFEIEETQHHGKNQADMALVVDMLLFGVDNPNSVIVLITGDRDFCHAITKLQERKCKVVLITPMVAHPQLHNKPNYTWNWDLFSGRGFRCQSCKTKLADGRHALLHGVDPIEVRTGDVFFMLCGAPCCVLPVHSINNPLIIAAEGYAPDPTNTYFQGYAWETAMCECGEHVGWYYTSLKPTELSSFYGFITAEGRY